MSDRPTPETDKRAWRAIAEKRGVVSVHFARALERQRDELAEALERIATSEYDDAFHAIEHCQQIAADALAKYKEAK